MNAVEQFVIERMERHWKPRPAMPMEEWLFKNLRLSRNQTTDYAGVPYDITNVPHARLIFDFLRDPLARELNIMKSSAAQLSTAVIAACVYRLWDDPCNIIYLIGNQDEAKKVSKMIWQPFLKQVFGQDVVDGQDQANLHLTINGVELFFGSPTEDMMRNKQVGIIVEDESDTLPEQLTGGAGGGQDLDVAEKERTKNTRGAKVIRLCTPLNRYKPDADKKIRQPGTRIHRHYLRGDQREFRVTCPACAMENPITRDHLIAEHCKLTTGAWDFDRMRDETFWRCPSCQGKVWDSSKEKRAMMQTGRWVATAPARSRAIWSAHHTDACSIIGNASWGVIMESYHDSDGDPQKRAGVMRSHFGEPEDLAESGSDRTREVIRAHCGHHSRGTCPIVPWIVGMVADVQKEMSFFPWMQAAFTQRGDCHVIDCGEAEDFAELEQIYATPIPLEVHDHQRPRLPDGSAARFVYCQRAAIDSGHFAKGEEDDPTAESVYRFCAGTFMHHALRFRWVPLKGRGGRQIAQNVLTDDSVAKVNATVRIPLHLINDPAFKRILYLIRLSDPAAPHPQKSLYPDVRLFREAGADDAHAGLESGERFVTFDQLLSELVSERLMDRTKRINGRMVSVREWGVPGSAANNLGDCLKMLLALHTLVLRQHQMAKPVAA